MTFSRKVFVAVLISTAVVGTATILTTYRYVYDQTTESFVSRYKVFSKVLGDTLTQLDTNTESLMLNAAQVINALDAESGLPTTKQLKSIRSDLNVTHIFITDSKGKFIRSTNEDPSLIPNAFSFCPEYKGMIDGNISSYATPVIHPHPEPKPYKFLFIPNKQRTRLLEVGVRVDFVAKTLTEALGADENVLSMAVYDPSGTSFGTFTAKNYEYKAKKIDIPHELPAVVDGGNVYRFYTKVASSHPKCCQCDVAGTSKNGEYYYVLESVISKKELSAIMAKTKIIFILVGLAILFIAAIFGNVLVRKLVKNIELAAEKVRAIRRGDSSESRISIRGNDEVAYLTKEFDELLDELESSQSKIIEAEKTEVKVQMAKEIAHNIKSPIIAIEMLLPTMFRLPEQTKSILKSSVKEIKTLSERLNKQAEAMAFDSVAPETMYIPLILKELVAIKQIEYSNRKDIHIELLDAIGCSDAFVSGYSVELKSIISNLINNAVESYGMSGGVISVSLECNDRRCIVTVKDSGVGIPSEYLSDLGAKQISFKGSKNRGLGLTHAFKTIESWGGKILIASEIGKGTSVSLELIKCIDNNVVSNNANIQASI